MSRERELTVHWHTEHEPQESLGSRGKRILQ